MPSTTEHTIEEIRLYRIQSAVNLQYGISHTTALHAMAVEVRSGEYSGWGEFDPRPWRRLFDPYAIGLKMARSLIGKDPLEPSLCLMRFPHKGLERDPWSQGINRALRCAREGMSLALYDLAGKLQGLPLSDLLGGAKRKTIPGMPVVHISRPDRMAKTSGVWCNELGYRFLKVKLSGDQEQNLRRLDAIRSEVGNEVDIQVDYNYGFRRWQDAVANTNEIHSRIVISVAEDPVRPFLDGILGLGQYVKMRRETDPQLMIDGVAYWPNVKRIVRSQAADIINHHTAMQGGLDLALLINNHAESAGINTAIGSSGLLGIADRAFQVLASVMALGRPCESIGWDKYMYAGFDGFYGIETATDLSKESPDQPNGNIFISEKPGIGIEIDRGKLSQLQLAEPVVIR